MSSERPVSFPEKPELNSPHFSYKVSNPMQIGKGLRLLRDKNESFVIQVGEENHGFLNSLKIVYPAIDIGSRGNGNYFGFGDLTLATELNLPRDHHRNFLDVIDRSFILNPKTMRRLDLQAKFRKYINKSLNFFGGCTGSTHIVNKDGAYIAQLPGYENGAFMYRMEDVIPANDSPENTSLLKMSLENALKTIIVFTTELYRYAGINADRRDLVIDPSLFKLVGETPRDLSSQEVGKSGDPKFTVFETLMYGFEGGSSSARSKNQGESDKSGKVDMGKKPGEFYRYCRALKLDPDVFTDLSKEEGDELLKKTYLFFARKHYPDNGGDEEKMKEINNARDFFNDPNNRVPRAEK